MTHISSDHEESCVFCQSLHPMAPDDGFVVYEDELVAASHTIDGDGQTYLGHFALQSKRHARGFAELTDAEAQAIGLAVSRVSWAIKQCTAAENVYEICFAEVVPHLHVLMTARYPGLPQEYWRMNVFGWPDAPRGDDADVRQLCAHMRQVLASGG